MATEKSWVGLLRGGTVMFSQVRRNRRKVAGVSSPHRASVLLGLVLIMLSSMGGSLTGLEDAWAQADPTAAEVPELVDDPLIEDEQQQDVETPEEPKATEPVAEQPQAIEIPKTEAPELTENPPAETKAVETEAVPSPTEDPKSGSTGAALWASNHLEVDAHGCPAGVDAAASSPAQLEATCGDNVGPVAFTLDNGRLGNGSIITSGDSAINSAVFETLDFEDDYDAPNAGEGRPVVLAASMPAGYLSVVVSCTDWNEAAGGIDWGPAIVPMADDRAIEVTVDAGHTLTCDWYFLPPLYVGEDSAVFDILPIAPTRDPYSTPTPDDSRPIEPIESIESIEAGPTIPGGFDPIIDFWPTPGPVARLRVHVTIRGGAMANREGGSGATGDQRWDGR